MKTQKQLSLLVIALALGTKAVHAGTSASSNEEVGAEIIPVGSTITVIKNMVIPAQSRTVQMQIPWHSPRYKDEDFIHLLGYQGCRLLFESAAEEERLILKKTVFQIQSVSGPHSREFWCPPSSRVGDKTNYIFKLSLMSKNKKEQTTSTPVVLQCQLFMFNTIGGKINIRNFRVLTQEYLELKIPKPRAY